MGAGKDTNYKRGEYADVDGVLEDGKNWIPTLTDDGVVDDVLKCSHVTRSIFRNGKVSGWARENGIDCNRMCWRVLFQRLFVDVGNQAAIVVKGGCREMEFDDVTIVPTAKSWCDVLWDDFSDQSRKGSTGVMRRVRRTDGKPLRVVFGRFKKPVFVDSPYEINWLETIGQHFYNYGKDLLRLAHLA